MIRLSQTRSNRTPAVHYAQHRRSLPPDFPSLPPAVETSTLTPVPLTSSPAARLAPVLAPVPPLALAVLSAVAVAYGVPLSPWMWLLLAFGALLSVSDVPKLRRTRHVEAWPYGLRISRIGGEAEVVVPWAQVRRIDVRTSLRGWWCSLEYQAAEGAAPVRVDTPYGAVWGSPSRLPQRLEQVRALWEAAVGPVPAQHNPGYWWLEPSPARESVQAARDADGLRIG